MPCGLCETYRLRISFLEEHSRAFDVKQKQLEKINDTLLNVLKSCDGNQDWKVKYQVLANHAHQMETKINKIQSKCFSSKTPQRKRDSLEDTINVYQVIKKKIISPAQSKQHISSYSTPKRQRFQMSSQKMQKFMTTLENKRNGIIKAVQKITQNVSSINKYSISTSRKLISHPKNLNNPPQNQNDSYRSYINKYFQIESNESKLFQKIFYQRKHINNIKLKPKSLIQVLVVS